MFCSSLMICPPGSGTLLVGCHEVFFALIVRPYVCHISTRDFRASLKSKELRPTLVREQSGLVSQVSKKEFRSDGGGVHQIRVTIPVKVEYPNAV